MIRAIINRLKKNEKGFTLIELMVVVAIIGILAAGIIPQFMNATNKAKVNAAKADLANFQTVLEIIYAEDGSYPVDSTGFTEMYNDGYIKSTTPKSPWGNSNGYNYVGVSNGSSYTITITGKSGQVSSSTGITGF